MTDDARLIVGRSRPAPVRFEELHDQLRHRLGGAGRELRLTRSGVPLHAAACQLPDGCGVVLAGASRSGKSTLTLALALERNAAVISDDQVWLADDATAHGFGRPLTVRRGSPFWSRAIQFYGSDVSGEHVIIRADDLGGPAMSSSTPIDLIVFPKFRAGEPSFARLGPAEAMCHLSKSLLRPIESTEMLDLARIVGGVPAAVIEYHDVHTSMQLCDRAAGLIQDFVACQATLVNTEELGALGGDVQGVRFGREVALLSRTHGEAIHLRDWPHGQQLAARSWDDLRGKARRR